MTERSGSSALSLTAFATLLLIALLMGANHVAARIAFDHGVDVATAVAVRSIATALVVGLLIVVQRAPVATTPRQRRFLLAIGLIVSACRASASIRRSPGCRSRSPCSPSTPIRSGPRSGRACSTPTGPSAGWCGRCR